MCCVPCLAKNGCLPLWQGSHCFLDKYSGNINLNSGFTQIFAGSKFKKSGMALITCLASIWSFGFVV